VQFLFDTLSMLIQPSGSLSLDRLLLCQTPNQVQSELTAPMVRVVEYAHVVTSERNVGQDAR
jgi:hypothetical protein